MTDTVIILTDATFDEEIASSDTPYLVDFWAAWCTPCLAMNPIIDRIAARTAGSLRVGKLNIVEYPVTPGRLQIASLPTLVVFEDGEIVKRIFGARSERQLLVQLGDLLPPPAN